MDKKRLLTKKMSKNINLQDMFLNQVRKEGVTVSIYLVSGTQIKGHVKGFDSFTILIEPQGKPTLLIYKHSITSIVPTKALSNQRSHSDEPE